jgi:hypothetical protein
MNDAPESQTIQFPFTEGDAYYEGYLYLIDILGFSNYVSEASFEDIKNIFQKFEDRIHDGNIHFMLPKGEYEKAISGQKWTGGKSFRPAFTFFSDTIFMSISEEALIKTPTGIYRTEKQRIKSESESLLMQVVSSATKIQFSLLKQGFLSRGAITFGKLYNKGSVWFGSPIVEAHQLEKYKENYAPRIILSDGVIEKLRVEQYLIENLRGGLILKDAEDGKIYCDYLAHPWLDDMSDLNTLQEIIEKNIILFQDNERIRKKWEWAKREYQKIPQV